MAKKKKEPEQPAPINMDLPQTAAEPRAWVGDVPVFCAHDELVAIGKAVPNPKNPRLHPPEQIRLLAAIIKGQGFRAPITISRRSGFIVKGHGRLQAAQLLGMEKIPIDFQNYSNDAEEWADLIADNRINELADTDEKILLDLIQEMDTGEFTMAYTGYSDDEIKAMIDAMTEEYPADTKEDDFDGDAEVETIMVPMTKVGDVWALGKHRLLCGDSTKTADVGKLMDGDKADLLFTDPPYGVAYEGGHNEKKRDQIKGDALAGEELTGLFRDALKQAVDHTHDHAAFYVWFASGKSVEVFAAFARLPLKLRAVIQWYKVHSGLGAFMAQYIPNCEPCIYAYKEGKSPQWFGPTDEKTVWEQKREGKNEFHPTQKPVELPARAIKNSTERGQIVLDLFGGSGSTMMACDQLGRVSRTMELDPKYCDVIVERYIRSKGTDGVYCLHNGNKRVPYSEMKKKQEVSGIGKAAEK